MLTVWAENCTINGSIMFWRMVSNIPFMSHSRAVPSYEAVRMCCPSGLNSAFMTEAVWPCRVTICFPLRSHNRAVPSYEAVRMTCPSGLKTALTTWSVWRSVMGHPGRVVDRVTQRLADTGLSSRAAASYSNRAVSGALSSWLSAAKPSCSDSTTYFASGFVPRLFARVQPLLLCLYLSGCSYGCVQV